MAVNTSNNVYLDGIGCSNPEKADMQWNPSDDLHNHEDGRMGGNCIYLWMSDYHPDGGQLFFPKAGLYDKSEDNDKIIETESNIEPKFPMFACLGKCTFGDDIRY